MPPNVEAASDARTRSRAVVVDGVWKRFGAKGDRQVLALEEVTLQVGDGEVVALLGPSGCGKSTLLRLIAGLLAPSDGKVLVYGEEVTEPHPIMGMMFQRPVLFPWLTVLENVLLPVRVQRARTGLAKPRAEELLRLVGLEEFAGHYPWQLSGGMQQRAAICRMLINEPRLLLLDEPFGALDELTREFMDVELRRIINGEGSSAVLVTHNPLEAAFIADRVVVLTPRPGRVAGEVAVALGPQRPKELFSSTELHGYVTKVRELFEGHAAGH